MPGSTFDFSLSLSLSPPSPLHHFPIFFLPYLLLISVSRLSDIIFRNGIEIKFEDTICQKKKKIRNSTKHLFLKAGPLNLNNPSNECRFPLRMPESIFSILKSHL